jgi:glycosyltransferase involved in cell wall biosynthesis
MGGQERVALDLAAAQHALGYRVIAVSLASTTPLPEGPLATDFRAHRIATETVEKRGAGIDATLPLRLARLFRRVGVEIVHTHNPQPLIYGAPAAKLAGARAVHTKHGANPGSSAQRALRRTAAHLCDAYVAVSDVTAEVARSHHEARADKLITIPNGVDLSRFHPDASARARVRSELGIPEDAWLVGTVGRLAPEKAQTLLIDAFAPMLSRERQLAIVGEGHERASLAATIAKLGERSAFVHLTGARRDVPEVLSAFDVFALTSSTEGLPLVIPEAMATGLPVVSTRVGGVPSVVEEGTTGLLVPAGDRAALAAALSRFDTDRSWAAGLGRAGRARALDRHSGESMARAYLELYERVRKLRGYPRSP